MALFLVSIHKEFAAQGEERPWVNTYHVNAADGEAALDVASSISIIEQSVHWSNIHFFRLSARQANVLGISGRQRQIDLLGTRDASGEQFLPSFCVARVSFSDLINRPDQKYLRLMINENEQAGGALEPSLITLLNDTYADAIIALPNVVSSNGGALTGSTVYPYVQNRQRDWHRRTRVGFKRGWVPV